MVVATHQPIFLPWPGFFYKALQVDALVLLDRVQFPQGRGWLHRNRLKSDHGEHWLRVPIRTAGRGRQLIGDVEICEDRDWRARHLRSVRELYAHAPYLQPHLTAVEAIYTRRHRMLAALNIDLIKHLWDALGVPTKLYLQSELGVRGRGADLLANVCQALTADTYLALTVAAKYIDPQTLGARRIELALAKFRPPVYPQLWGDFRYNLSTLDLVLNCGPKARDIILTGTQ
ncbi:MAG: hypothetical protein EHM55_05090 [Acidobacteria bacterium]|nr:MAG: hypothetical protein EHM55_05090 [Acidobacteriota bacterium]